jgi:beta-phosphoglucomutase-like phosphatase (HAD superfamily)
MPDFVIPNEAHGLVFDFDGTLVDSMLMHHTAWSACLDDVIGPHAFDLAMIVALAGTGIHDLFRIICEKSNVKHDGDLDKRFFAELPSYYLKNHQPVTAIECVKELVIEGHRRGLPLAICSGGTRTNILTGLKETGLDEYFQPHLIISCEDVAPGRGKPEPDSFLKAAQLINVDPSRCVGFEDAKLGMAAIRAAKYLLAIDVTEMEGYPRLNPTPKGRSV